jgi:hypothetical protein
MKFMGFTLWVSRRRARAVGEHGHPSAARLTARICLRNLACYCGVMDTCAGVLSASKYTRTPTLEE